MHFFQLSQNWILKKDSNLLKTVFLPQLKFTALLLVPSTILLMTLSTPLVTTLFGDKFPFAPIFLTLSIAVNLYVVFGNISLNTFQNGIGATRQVMKQSVLSLVISLPLSYALIYYLTLIGGTAGGQFNAVVGGIISILISSVPGMVWGLIWSYQKYKAKADFKVSAKIVFASLLAAGVTSLFLFAFNLPSWVMLVLGALIFLVVYSVAAPLIGAINRDDVDNLMTMISGLGVISTVANYFLSYMRKLCKPNSNNHYVEQQPEGKI
jgi:O-antigen/teichoic acid export membrane protein